MKGSCIIVPCTFNYTKSQPAGLRVIWYLFQTSGYPPVFDQSQSVISKFNGKTHMIGSVGERNCSLKIDMLDMSHNKDRLYPWVDKNPITSFQSLGANFAEKTSQLIVSGKYLDAFIPPFFGQFNLNSKNCSSPNVYLDFIDQAQEPQLGIIGIPRVGEESIVTCNVRHTCISAPPSLTLHGVTGKDNITDTLVSDGIWERTVERTWAVKEQDQSVKCTVRYSGGQTASSELKLNVECEYK